MTRAEILSEIKRAEEEAKNLVAQANEARNQRISEAKVQARDILKKAEEEALRYAASEISRAREIIKEEREKIVEKGAEVAEDIKNKARKNITKATKFILTEFERAAANA
ncbi:MAG: ATP synthase archaeal subunit H [Euryarchaeota archaeon]|nr:ATP synthase archaeal subunit H [Euryarchaeota archaeon]MCG2727915.1 ATP synthase archaeal subunit H [Candidatus Methanoperedenaceae archaeon]